VETAYRVSPLRESDPGHLGAYTLEGRLGSGGMGVVYLGRAVDGRYVAVKTVHAELAQQPEFQQRFRGEIARLRTVPPFCTAELLDADLDHDPPFLVIEYVDGPSLAEVVEQRGLLRAAQLQSLAVGTATALVGIHGAGVVHRDLKPENVLLPPGNPKVIDFGIARAVEAASRHTGTGRTIGTIAYMAPERIDMTSSGPVTSAADVFAWGCVVVYAATGRSPFLGDSSQATAARILTQPPNLDGIEEPLRGIVDAALVKEPQQRPTARELLDLLLHTAAEQPAQAHPEPVHPIASARPIIRRRRRFWAVAAAAGLAVAVGVTTAIVANRDSPTSAPTTDILIKDDLKAPSAWRNSEGALHKAKCTVDDTLTVVRLDRKPFMCTGSETLVNGDFSAQVAATLRTKSSCAALWFHWNPGRGGHVVRICQDDISLAADTPDGMTVVGSLPAAQRIQAGWTAHVRIEVEKDVVRIYRGGDLSGQLNLPPGSPSTGKIRLGIDVQPQGGEAPFTVAFAGLTVHSL
jgi:serine/threonine protein kinase